MIGHLVARTKAAKLTGSSRHKRSLLITDTLDEFFFKQTQRVARQLQSPPMKLDRGEIVDSPGFVKDILDLDIKR